MNETWKLNLAHVFYVKEKYQEAMALYESIFKKNADNIIELPAIIIANLCVSCVMMKENEKAEEYIRLLEEAEKIEAERNP